MRCHLQPNVIVQVTTFDNDITDKVAAKICMLTKIRDFNAQHDSIAKYCCSSVCYANDPIRRDIIL